MGMIMYGYWMFMLVAILSIPFAIALVYGIIEFTDLFSNKDRSTSKENDNVGQIHKKINLKKSYDVKMARPLTETEIQYYKALASNKSVNDDIESTHNPIMTNVQHEQNQLSFQEKELIEEANKRLEVTIFFRCRTLQSKKEWLHDDEVLLRKLQKIQSTDLIVFNIKKRMVDRISAEKIEYRNAVRIEKERIRSEIIADRKRQEDERKREQKRIEVQRIKEEKERKRKEREKERERLAMLSDD